MKPPRDRKTAALRALVEWLADDYAWNWTVMSSNRDAADAVLAKIAALGLLKHAEHEFGGDIWEIDGHRYGRIDD